MPPALILLTALVTGLAALALTPWTRTVAATDSRWLRCRVHIALAGLGGAGAAALATSGAELVAYTLLALACALLIVIDLTALRLPDAIVLRMYPMLLIALGVAAAVGDDWGRLGRATTAAGVLLIGYFLLAFIYPSGLGLGDVKLSGLLGMFLGWLGWPHLLLGTLAAFILSAILSVVLLVTTNATRRTAVPFGPWMVAGAAVGAAWGPAALAGTV